MPFPLIDEYMLAVQDTDNFLKLKGIVPVMNKDNKPYFAAGGFAVVFKMTKGNQKIALKCFTRENKDRKRRFEAISAFLKALASEYFVGYEYLANELYVDGTEYDVVAMDWVEGQTLGNYLKEKIAKNDRNALKTISDKMDALAKTLLGLPLAHGDLKPDNIMVNSAGELRLVDYDGMFVPDFEGENSPEMGTPAYQHPLRKESDYHRNLDDVSLLILCCSLRAIAENPLLMQGSDGEVLIFSEQDLKAPMKTDTWMHIFTLPHCAPWLAVLHDTLKQNHIKTKKEHWKGLLGEIKEVMTTSLLIEELLKKEKGYKTLEQTLNIYKDKALNYEKENKVLEGNLKETEKIYKEKTYKLEHEVNDLKELIENIKPINVNKILAFVCIILCIIIFFGFVHYKSEVQKVNTQSILNLPSNTQENINLEGFKNDILKLEQMNKELQNENISLKKSNEQFENNNKKLASLISKMSLNIPFLIENIDFCIENEKREKISNYTNVFNFKTIKYISPRIKLIPLIKESSKPITLNIKFIKPNGELMKKYNNYSNEYSYISEELIYPASEYIYLIGWGSNEGGDYEVGTHTVEIWHNGKIIGSNKFQVIR
jgi:serine/threonine protein kinase